MNVSLKACLLACASSLVVGMLMGHFAKSAFPQYFGLGVMCASIGIGIALLISAEME